MYAGAALSFTACNRDVSSVIMTENGTKIDAAASSAKVIAAGDEKHI